MGSKITIGILSVAILGMLYVYGIVAYRAVSENGILVQQESVAPDDDERISFEPDTPNQPDTEATALNATEPPSQDAPEQAATQSATNSVGNGKTFGNSVLSFTPSFHHTDLLLSGISNADNIFDKAQGYTIDILKQQHLDHAVYIYESIIESLEAMELVGRAGMTDTPEYKHCVEMVKLIKGY